MINFGFRPNFPPIHFINFPEGDTIRISHPGGIPGSPTGGSGFRDHGGFGTGGFGTGGGGRPGGVIRDSGGWIHRGIGGGIDTGGGLRIGGDPFRTGIGAEDARRRAEEQRQAEERRRSEEARRRAEQAAEDARRREEQRRSEEARQRTAQAFEDARRFADGLRRAGERRQLEAQRRSEEARRLEEQQAAEGARGRGRETTHHEGLEAAEKGLETAEKIHKGARIGIEKILQWTHEYTPEAIENLERFEAVTETLGLGKSVVGTAKSLHTLTDPGATKDAKLEAGIDLVSNGLQGQKSALAVAEALGVISKVPAIAETLGFFGIALDGTWKAAKLSLQQGAEFMGAAGTMDVQQAYRQLNEHGSELRRIMSEANAIQQVMDANPSAADALGSRLEGALSNWHDVLQRTAGDFTQQTSTGGFTQSGSVLEPSHYRAVFDSLPSVRTALNMVQDRQDVASLNDASRMLMTAISGTNRRVSDALGQRKTEMLRR